jgi:hypothetical protein
LSADVLLEPADALSQAGAPDRVEHKVFGVGREPAEVIVELFEMGLGLAVDRQDYVRAGMDP